MKLQLDVSADWHVWAYADFLMVVSVTVGADWNAGAYADFLMVVYVAHGEYEYKWSVGDVVCSSSWYVLSSTSDVHSSPSLLSSSPLHVSYSCATDANIECDQSSKVLSFT